MKFGDGNEQSYGYFWKTKNRFSKKTVLYLHGGPYLQSKPVWDIQTKIINTYGFNLLSLNYHGSSGYSEKYALNNNIGKQTDDVLKAIEYLKNRYGIRSKDIVLMGSSYGGEIAYNTVLRDKSIMGLILISSTLSSSQLKNVLNSSNVKVLSFFGDLDQSTKIPYSNIRASKLEELVNFKSILLKNEGHLFHLPDSWHEVYSSLILNFQ